MNEDILAVLEEKASTFSKGQRKIAAYITEYYDKAAWVRQLVFPNPRWFVLRWNWAMTAIPVCKKLCRRWCLTG